MSEHAQYDCEHFQRGVEIERQRVLDLLDQTLMWAKGDPEDPEYPPFTVAQTINLAKRFIGGELSTVTTIEGEEGEN